MVSHPIAPLPATPAWRDYLVAVRTLFSVELVVGLIERQQKVSVPFGYINGTLLEVRSYEDAAHPVHTQLWSQHDDPRSGPRDPIVGEESQPSIRSIVRLM